MITSLIFRPVRGGRARFHIFVHGAVSLAPVAHLPIDVVEKIILAQSTPDLGRPVSAQCFRRGA